MRAGLAEEAIVIDLQAVITLATALMQRGAPDIAERFEAGLDTTRIDASAVGLRTGLFERLDQLVRDDVGKVRQHLADFHHRSAQVAHRIEQLDRRLEVGLGEVPLPLVGVLKPAANPAKSVGHGNLRLQSAE